MLLILISFSNYFANYFANYLSQNFLKKILVISPDRLACGTFLFDRRFRGGVFRNSAFRVQERKAGALPLLSPEH
jgi:hypothetical protein